MEWRFLTLALALVIDKVFGEPEILWKHVPHPIIWFGNSIEIAEKTFNSINANPQSKRRVGFIVITVLLILSALLGALMHWLFIQLGVIGFVGEALVASIFLAHKSLIDHVRAVPDALRNGGLPEGRVAVGRIVGRDTASLDNAGVCRAAVESLAENFADGVVAPVFWYAVAGLPGLLAYKMLNTADSMIGHMNDRYRDFGRASAKMDDVANFLPARISGMLYVLASAFAFGMSAARRSFSTMMRDARLHRSPNSGWPEAAMAGALNIALAGPRTYRGELVNEPLLNSSGEYSIGNEDVSAAIHTTNLVHIGLCLCVILMAIICL